MGAYMMRDINRVGDGVPVLPTMAAKPTAPEAPGNPKLARPARRDATPGRGRKATPGPSDSPKPAQAPATLPDEPGMSPGARRSTTGVRRTAPSGGPAGYRRVQRWLEIASLAACLVAGAAGWWLYRSEVDNRVEMPIPPVTRASDDLARVQQALQQERDNAEKLGRELAAAKRELRSPAAALTKAGDAELRQTLQQSEWLSATYKDLLVQERARNQELEQQLAARRDAAPDRGRDAAANLLDTPDPTQAPATDKSATAPLANSHTPAIPAGDKSATTWPTAPEAPANPELAHLMARASVLLVHGNIGAARIVLERAAETGSAPALFALAETYDPVVLSAWGTVGTQGDVAKAQELYAKALAGGVQEAKDRLNALRQ